MSLFARFIFIGLIAVSLISDAKGPANAQESVPWAQCSGTRPILALGVEGLRAICEDGKIVREFGSVGPAIWSPSGKRIAAFTTSTKGRSLVNLKLFHFDNGDSVLVRLLPDEYLIRWQPIWSPDGTKVAAIVIGKDVAEVRVYQSDDGRLLGQYGFPGEVLARFRHDRAGWNIFRWSPDGEKILIAWSGVVVVNLKTERFELITPNFAVADWTSHDDAVCYISFNRSSGKIIGLFRKPLKDKKAIQVADADQLELAGIRPSSWLLGGLMSSSPSGRLLALSMGTKSKGYDAIRIYDADKFCANSLNEPIKTIPTRLVTHADWSPDETKIAILEQLISTGKKFRFAIRSIDIESQKRSTIDVLEFEGAGVDAMGLVRLFSWTR